MLALAFALNRADHNERVITPFLDGGDQRVVILRDRYMMSSLVINSTGGLSIEDVMQLNAGAGPPDLTLFLDAQPGNEPSAYRIAGRNTASYSRIALPRRATNTSRVIDLLARAWGAALR